MPELNYWSRAVQLYLCHVKNWKLTTLPMLHHFSMEIFLQQKKRCVSPLLSLVLTNQFKFQHQNLDLAQWCIALHWQWLPAKATKTRRACVAAVALFQFLCLVFDLILCSYSSSPLLDTALCFISLHIS